jgi:hypothetical protein
MKKAGLVVPGVDRLYQYGVNLGGPIVKDKVWWFGSWAIQDIHKRTDALNRTRLRSPGILPGDWGKAESGWLTPLLWMFGEGRANGGRIHQFLWRCSRAVSKREKGTVR